MTIKLEVGKTYKRTNQAQEELSHATINAENLAYHQDLSGSITYEEIIVRRIHTAPGDSTCITCEG